MILPDRAVAVVVEGGTVLAMRRHKDGADYCVLPGGGVEAGEAPHDTVVRELREETGLCGVVERHLWTIEHADRRAHYFLVSVVPGRMTVGGPEAARQSEHDRYRPEWIAVDDLVAEDLRPETIRSVLTDELLRSSPAKTEP